MKIKEIDNEHRLDEGPIDWLKGKVGAFQGAGTRNAVSKDLYNKWMQSVGMDPSAANDPAALQQFIAKSAPNVKNVPMPTDMSPGGVNDYITKVTGQNLAAAMRNAPDAKDWTDRLEAQIAAQQNGGANEQPVKTDTPGLTVTSGMANPNTDPTLNYSGKNYSIDDASGKWVDEAGNPANDKLQGVFYQTMGKYAKDNAQLLQGFNTLNGATPGTGAVTAPAAKLAQGVELYNDEPMMLKWNKGIYQVLDDGRWHQVAPQYNKAPVDPAIERFLTQQADIATPESPVRQVPVQTQAPSQRQADQAVQSYRDTDAILPDAPATVPATNVAPTADVLAQRQATNTAPATTAPAAPTPVPTAPTNMQSTSNATTTMAPGSGSYQVPGRVIPSSPYAASAYKPIVKPSTKPATATTESVDLGEVLCRKMKSKRR